MIHVPAWKRIGLNLKRPNESHTAEGNDVSSHTSKKPKLNGSSSSSERRESLGKSNGNVSHANQESSLQIPSKIKKQAARHLRKPSATNDTSTNQPAVLSTASQSHSSIESEPSDTGLKKRKSVTFSPDAKAKDGPLVDLDYSELKEGEQNNSNTPAPKPKKNKKPRTGAQITIEEPLATSSDADGQLVPADSSTRPYLVYLDEYHNNPDRWKFNKNLQIQVLKNMFNVHRMPPTYDLLLKRYLSGLKGESRTRLRADANELLAKIASHDSTASDDVANNIEGDVQDTLSVNARKQNRARIVLDALGGELETPQDPISAKSTPAKPDQEGLKASSKRSRGRKRRTALDLPNGIDTSSDDDSDSDESTTSSSSSSSDSSEDSETSSESSSDSGSGSGSDSDEKDEAVL